MKAPIILTLISLLMLWQDAFSRDQSMQTPVEELTYGCGYSHALAYEQEAVRNTSARHPEWGRELLKQNKSAYQVGDSLVFYTYNYKNNQFDKTMALCRLVSDKTYIFVGKNEWEADQVSDVNVNSFQQGFDISTPSRSINPNAGIRKILEDTFGPAPNKSGDGFVYILIYDIQEQNTQTSYTAGYFMPNDQTDGLYSNRKDVLYIDCNPGKPGNANALSFVAHEFQHLLHYGADRDEDYYGGTWVNEGASEYASVICGYALRSPAKYLRKPERSLLNFDYTDETLLDYEKVALWTFYLGEKFGPSFVGQIIRQPENSVNGVRAALVTKGITLTFEDLFSNFVVANYINNINLDPQGYYGYNSITLPIVPPSADYGGYPVDTKLKELPMYSTQYIRFFGQDSTAELSFSSLSRDQTRALLFHIGDNTKVETLPLNSQGEAKYSLKAIGKTAHNLVLAPANLGGNNVITYLVTTLIEDTKPPVITSGPRESISGSSSTTIIWDTDEYANSVVEYGTSSNYGRIVQDTTMATSHRVTLTGLSTNTTYHYRVGVYDAKKNGPTYSTDFTFATLLQTGKKIATLQQSHSYGNLGRSLSMAPDQSTHFIYHEKTGADRFIYHQQSNDQGSSWSLPVKVDDTLISGGMPSMAIDNLGQLHVSWHAKATTTGKYSIYYSRSDNNGMTWSSPQLVSTLLPDHDQLYSSIAVDANNNPHIVWNSALYDDRYEGDVYHVFSKDRGQTWQADMMIGGSTIHHCYAPSIDFDSKGRCYLVYSDGVFDQKTLNAYITWSEDYITWQPPHSLSNSGVLYDAMVAMVVDGQDRIHVAFADNYTPGDIRIMYAGYTAGDATLLKPVAASTFGRTGDVFHPSLSCDDKGMLYLLYCDSPRSLSLNKAKPKTVDDIDTFHWNRSQALSGGDIYLSLNRKGTWLPGVNVSNDAEDSQNPEMPRRQKNNATVQLIWMNLIAETSNDVQFMNFNAAGNLTASPHVVDRRPAPDSRDVPYFSSNPITVTFDQRIVSDSLVPENVILSGSKSGVVAAALYYVESLKQVQIVPVTDLQPSEEVTIRLSSHITNEIGLGLDGNGNGTEDGSPVDDVAWTFFTQAPDMVAPVLAIGLAQNPVLTRYMDLYVFSQEALKTAPAVHIAAETIPMTILNPNTFMYKGDFKLTSDGVLQIDASATDLAGNTGSTNRTFTAALMKAAQGGSLASADGRVKLYLPPGAMTEDAFVTIIKNEPTDFMQDGRLVKQETAIESYTLGPEQAGGQIVFNAGPTYQKAMVIQRQDGNNRWIDLPTVEEDNRLMAVTNQLGVFRLAESEQMPAHFELTQNYPNPFTAAKERTAFLFQLPQRQQVTVAIYNVLGEKVATLMQGEVNPGMHRIIWNGLDAFEMPVAAGLYFYRCTAGVRVLTKKMILVR